MIDVEVWLDFHYGKMYYYSVMVDGKPYDHFTSRSGALTWKQLRDVAAGYQEALSAHG